jgi:hypothetical protein
MTPSIEEAVELLKSALRESVREEEKQKILQSLSNGTPITSSRGARQSAPGRVAKPRPKGAKRDPADIEQLTRDLIGFVKKNPQSRIEQIAQGLGVTTKDLALPTRKLIADKQLKVTGQRRGTRYSVR